ncbi:hypothetical protein [Herbidospora cretacea]|uniref:hypothetical protein n=1 Tax=Herbidospora cretacea TaxID=28444 RepID=UPI0004C43ECA|nr:hypothetical protein [Herbidospora cretacea]
MERARQFTGEVLVCLFLVILGTGVWALSEFAPGGTMVLDEASPGAEIYGMVFTFDSRDGLISRDLHQSVATVFLACTVVWALLGRHREGAAVFLLGLLVAFSGHRLAGGPDLATVWYGTHFAAAAAIVVILLRSSAQEARLNRRTPAFVATALAATAFLVFVL